RADVKDRAAVRDRLPDELVRAVDVVERLLQVDDVDAVALGEDVTLHLRVPAPGLVAKVDAALKELLHRDDRGHRGPSIRARDVVLPGALTSVDVRPGSCRSRRTRLGYLSWCPLAPALGSIRVKPQALRADGPSDASRAWTARHTDTRNVVAGTASSIRSAFPK